jgi:putative ABC transport system permease protein
VAEYGDLEELTMEQGRFLMSKDVANRNNVAVIDTVSARRLFPDGQAIGESIRLANHYFLVVGLLAPERRASSESGETSVVGRAFIPLTTMHSRYGDMVLQRLTSSFQVERYELSRIRVVMASASSASRAAAVIESLMGKYHERADYSVRTVGASSQEP